MNDLESQKAWIGDNFFDFYIHYWETWTLWATVGVAFLLTCGMVAWGWTAPAYGPMFWKLIGGNAVMCVFLGLFFSIFDVHSTRDRRRRQIRFIEKLQAGEPVGAGDATIRYYGEIQNGMDPDDTIKIRTKIDTVEMKVSQIPDNRVELPSLFGG